jgi:hypothetical protein
MHKHLFVSVVVVLVLSTSAFAVRYPIASMTGPDPGQVGAIAAQGNILAVSFAENASQIDLYSQGNWEPLAVLTIASDPNAVIRSIAITPGYIVSGSYEPSSGIGSAYVFQLPSGGQWQDENETAELSPSDPQNGNAFGVAVAAWGTTVVVGAPLVGSYPETYGKGYVFVEPDQGWANVTETAQLTSSNQSNGEELGAAVGTIGLVGENGNEIALSAPYQRDQNGVNAGAVYIYEEPQRGWSDMTETTTLTDNGAGSSTGLGYSIGFGKDTIVAAEPGEGLNGSVAVYEKNLQWQTTSQPNVRITNSQVYNWISVAIREDGSRIVACCGTNTPHKGNDLAFLYRKSSGFQQQTALSTHGLAYDQSLVAITTDYAFLGDYFEAEAPAVVYVFDGD